MTLQERVDHIFAAGDAAPRDEGRAIAEALRAALSSGTVRAAEPDESAASGWRVNSWVKRGILLAFRFGDIIEMTVPIERASSTRTLFRCSPWTLAAVSASSPADRASATAPTSATA